MVGPKSGILFITVKGIESTISALKLGHEDDKVCDILAYTYIIT